MVISELFPSDWILADLKSRTKADLFKEVCSFVGTKRPDLDRDLLLSQLWEREKLMTTGIALGVALPHTNLPNVGPTVGVLGLSRKGIEYQSLDGESVHLVFFLLGDESQPDEHILVLKSLAMLLTNPEFYPSMMKSRSARDIAATLAVFEVARP